MRPQIGDRVGVSVSGRWQRFGTVVETDYHPLGIDDAVKIEFDGKPVKSIEWHDARHVTFAAANGMEER